MSVSWQEAVEIGDRTAPEPTAAEQDAEPRGRPVRGRLRRFRESLSASRRALGAELSASVLERLDDADWERLEEALILADCGAQATADVVARLEAEVDAGELTSPETVRSRMAELVAEILAVGETPVLDLAARPAVVTVVGVNGTGKTTTIGKLAMALRRELGLSVLVAAADTYRAAAVEQLETWSERAGAEIVRAAPGGDPGAVAFDAIEAATARGIDVVIADTAGRLHTHGNLMGELEKVHRVIERKLEGAPHETLLVIDATTGQNGLRQAKAFTEAVGVTGVVLTKLDGSARGGVALAIARELGLAVKLAGTGEGIEDLRVFDAPEFARALVGVEDGEG